MTMPPMPPDDRGSLSTLKQAYLALERLQARLDGIENARREPIAIIGIGCRFPGGAGDPDAFWRLLRGGGDAVAEVPPERWDIDAFYDPDPDVPGKMSSRWGAWIGDIDRFDPRFFGIAPREAVGMDPQQRLVLEVAWEALERAGQAPDRLSGSRTGVYLGLVNNDYAQLQARGGATRHIDPYFGSGNAHSVASGRLSYILGLQGPSLSIDTACSSSLVAVHLAAQSLRQGECDMALAGGVNLMLVPETTIALSKLHMLAPDGRCKAFDARADGFVRGEGAGLVVLKRLSDALAHRDPIVALILGTAVNQDGPSSGLTVPNGPAQAAVIRAALRDGGVAPADVTFVETHGTGTALGDPLEVRALAEALGPDRPADRPIHIGSVKTNIGHLEAAAGIAGLIKAALALRHGAIPPHLHLTSRNPHLPWDRLPVEIPTTYLPWPAEAPRVAGVSSFGFSGTNAHIVLAAAPPQVEAAEPTELADDAEAAATARRPSHVLCLSAGTDAALRALATRYADHLAQVPGLALAGTALADVCFTANAGRAALSHRLALPVTSADQAAADLRAVARGEVPDGTARGQALGADPPRIAFLFTGQGAQYAGMGRPLFESEPTFRHAIERCDAGLQGELEHPLISVLYPDLGGAAVDATLIDDTTYTQPALFALAYALVALWRSWGIAPDAVLGHSAGELAAACAAGVLSLEDGLRLCAARGRLMGGLPRDGAMAAVRAGEDRVRAAIAAQGGVVAIAAVNGPADTVISGRAADLDAVLGDLQRDGITARRLNVSHPFHSPLIDPILDDLARAAGALTSARPAIPWIGNLTGVPITAADLEAGAYWRAQARSPVRFADGMAALRQMGIDVFLEIGPDPVLLGMGRRCLPDEHGAWLPSLRRGRDAWQTLLAAAGALFARGAPVDWEGFDRGAPRRRVALPTYPFQRSRYWLDPAPMSPESRAVTTSGGHPLLGVRLGSPLADWQFESHVDAGRLAFIADHRVKGRTILPAVAYLELALAAAERIAPHERREVGDLVIHAPLVFDAPDLQAGATARSRRVQTVVAGDRGGDLSLRIFALPGDVASGAEPGGGAWTLHASARLIAVPASAGVANGATTGDGLANGAVLNGAAASEAPPTAARLLDEIRARCAEVVASSDHRAHLRERGLDFGPSLHGVADIRRRDGEALGRVRLPEGVAGEIDVYRIHPALLDACLQVVGEALPRGMGGKAPYFPLAIDRCRLLGRPLAEVFSHVVLRETSGDRLTADIRILDAGGALVAEMSGLHLVRATTPTRPARLPEHIADWLYEIAWHPKPLPGAPEAEPGRDDVWPGAHIAGSVDLVARLAPRLAALAAEQRLDDHRTMVEQLGVVVALYLRQAFTRLGWDPRPGEVVSAEALVAQLGIQARYGRLVARLLAILAEDGVLAAVDEGFEVRTRPAGGDAATGPRSEAGPGPEAGPWSGAGPDHDPAALLAALRRSYPASEAPIALSERCGPRLAEVLVGAVDPLDLLFPGGSIETAERLYKESPEAHVFQALAGEAVAAALGERPPGRRLSILEIGAGTGGTTAFVLPRLPREDVHYTFTDISPHFLDEARRTFGEAPFVDYRALDIERDPTAQGFAPGAYDIVLAANVLHATADLRRSLDHVRALLAPGGRLVMLEGSTSERWIDITFGLTGGWWRFTDTDRRLAGPLIGADAWRALLAEAGFVGASALTAPSDVSHQALLTARSPVDDIAGTWLVLADAGGLGRRLAERLAAAGASPRLVRAGDTLDVAGDGPWQADPTRPADLARVVEAAALAGPQLRGVVHLWGLDIPAPREDAPTSLEPAMRPGLGGALHLVRALVGTKLHAAPRLWLVTRGAWAAGFAQAPLWGLGRVVTLEHPELGCVRVDLDDAADHDAHVAALHAEVSRPDGEDGIAYRAGLRHAARLVRSVAAPDTDGPAPAVRLVADRGGVLDDMRWVATERRAPGPGEVEIRVRATGLNFRDVLNALAMRDDPDPLGSECGGWITAVGAGVDGLAVGEAVVAVAPGSFSHFVTTRAELVAPLPAGIDFAGGATLPMAFLTAEHALRHVAGLARGERVLIHAAAGGVGQAAVQIAQRVGAEVFATAGSPDKRAYLSSMGVPHVFDSRSLDFADALLRSTGGRGVDVVLNQLSGDFIPASLRALADAGRFVEIGKRDIWSPAQVAAVKPRAAYHVVDLSALMVDDPECVRALFHALIEDLRAGALKPLPAQTFPFDAAPDAFRFMAQARHIGKVVLVPPDAADTPGGAQDIRFRADASYLITGGLSGLGLAVAEWMAGRGARQLVLVGRRPPDAAARARLAALEADGVGLRVAQGDVADAARMAEVLAETDATMPPLRGVIHAAGVLDDGALVRQAWQRFATVLAPKVDGAWNLHVLTQGRDLDWFVLFSSAAAVFGSRGQANHAAANAFLDALAQQRRARGRPAVSIDWGAWSAIGAAAERGVLARVQARGIGPIEPSRGLEAFAEVLHRDRAQVLVAPIDWARYLDDGADGSPAWLAEMRREVESRAPGGRDSMGSNGVRADGAGEGGAAGGDAVDGAAVDGGPRPGLASEIRAQLADAPPALRRELLLGFVTDQAVRVLGLPRDQAIEPRQPLHDLGLDSLMAVELRNRLAAGLALEQPLPATLVFDHPSTEALATQLMREWPDAPPATGASLATLTAASDGSADDLLASIEALSEDEIDRRLAGSGPR